MFIVVEKTIKISTTTNDNDRLRLQMKKRFGCREPAGHDRRLCAQSGYTPKQKADDQRCDERPVRLFALVQGFNALVRPNVGKGRPLDRSQATG